MVNSDLVSEVVKLLNHRIHRVLTYGQMAMSEPQFKVFRTATFDEFGEKGFESDLKKLLSAGKHSDELGSGRE